MGGQDWGRWVRTGGGGWPGLGEVGEDWGRWVARIGGGG